MFVWRNRNDAAVGIAAEHRVLVNVRQNRYGVRSQVNFAERNKSRSVETGCHQNCIIVGKGDRIRAQLAGAEGESDLSTNPCGQVYHVDPVVGRGFVLIGHSQRVAVR